ncbi:AAA family ATPase [Accumulibacter sp.]|uniref:AAA family ATPase n=1 Tax=Accumulibacter sp. TaxID=2053492 RepID=UPI002D1FB4E9|nr:AAA family ATPase [Accumulibacter sp.]
MIPPAEGKKLFLSGCRLPPDACHVVGGPIRDDGLLFIVEGPGQAWSAHQATRRPAVVAFGFGRVAGVARALRERHPAARLVLVADAGKESQCSAIARDVNGAWVEMSEGSARNADINDIHVAEGLGAVGQHLARAKVPAQRWKLHDADQFADQPPLEWLVKGLIPRRGVVAFYGASGCGKSFLVVDLFGCVVSGRDWFGLRTVRVPALYLCLEGAAGFGKRLAAYRIEVGSLAGMKVVAEPFRLNDRQDEDDIIDLIRNTGMAGGVICIDTLAQATPGMDENSGEGMTLAIAACQRIQQATDSLILLVHHVGKDSTKGLRGHSSLIGALDASVEVSGGIDGAPRQWEARKVKDDATGEPHHFALRRAVLGIDEDGDEITSCVIEQAEAATNSVRKARLPSGGNMKIAWDRMGELLKSPAVVFGKASAPPGRPCVDLEAATGDIAARLTCDPKRRRERAEQAITALVARGVLAHQEGWLWLK